MIKQLPANSNTVADGNVAVAAVKFALSQIGVKYQWGGADPQTGFDCSGLVLWSYGKAGMPGLPHYTGAQIPLGQPVSSTDRTQWHVGDLIFPDIGHVQLYVGGNTIVEAPHTGAFVQHVTEWAPSVMAVRRLVTGSPASYTPGTQTPGTAAAVPPSSSKDCSASILGACIWKASWGRAIGGGLLLAGGSLVMLGAVILMTASTKSGQSVLADTGPYGQVLKKVAA